MKINNTILTIFLLPALFFGLNATGQVIDTKITHIVKPGESLHSITHDYLGTDVLWKENWKLNPQVQNPHLLSIGQALIIIKQRQIPSERATMIDVVNKVERKKHIGDWKKAIIGDELNQQEGVRTFEKSSALLKLSNESEFKILEYSQVFLQSRKTTLLGTDSATIEIIKGDAELNWTPLDIKKLEIEIISGSTKLKPFIKKGMQTALRTGITDNGSSVISVYKGNSNVESAGKQVLVPQGMGLKVKKGQEPPEPKPLLRSPKLSSSQSEYNYSNPILYWHKVPKARAYLLEICADKKCSIVTLQKKTRDTHWQIQDLNKKGTFYWRVAAQSEEQIIGFRSDTRILHITDINEDKKGPFIAIDIVGMHKYLNGKTIISPSSRLNIFSIDGKAGLQSLYYKWDNNTFQKWNETPLSVPQSPAVLTIKATDQLNQVTIKDFVVKIN
ncbi:MAG: LysM peptidoglycan-binding domain-containing protein [Alcanivoracaceae bacterium]|nr:LysM peptidoglycan-binding domain-containing protein [Alcanivoracaceae bacterium]